MGHKTTSDDGRGLFWREWNTVIDCWVNVVQNVEGGIPVALRRFVVVRQKEWVGDSKVWMCAACQPTDESNDTLIFLFAFNEGRTILVFVWFRDSVDWKAGLVRSGVDRYATKGSTVVLNKMRCKVCLAEMDGYLIFCFMPLEMSDEKPFNRAHKINCNQRRE